MHCEPMESTMNKSPILIVLAILTVLPVQAINIQDYALGNAHVTFTKGHPQGWLGEFIVPRTIIIHGKDFQERNGLTEQTLCHELRHKYEYDKYGLRAFKYSRANPDWSGQPHFYEEKLNKVTWTEDKCYKNSRTKR